MNDTGTISPLGPGSRFSRSTVCSSCQTTFSQVDRSLPEPVTVLLMQVRVRWTVLSSGRRPAAIRARSGPPSVAVPLSSSSQDAPKRQKRSVRLTAQIRSAAPANGKMSAIHATGFPWRIAGTAPRKVAGAATRFQKIANAQAKRRWDWERMRTGER